MIECLKAVVLGIVQGLTEFLPISSSGHLSVFQHFMNINNGGEGSNLLSVLLHIGTLLAVLLVYYKTLWEMIVEFFKAIGDIFKGKFSFKNMNETRRMIVMMIISCVPLLLLLIPIGNGNMLMDFLGGLSSDSDIIVEGFAFLFTAALLLGGTRISEKKSSRLKEVDTKSAIFVGIAQFFAAGFPGISRSGSTISTGMLCGVDKEYMVRYSFILGIPAIIAANVMEIKDALETNADVNILAAIIGIAVAAVVGFAAIKILEWLVKKEKFKIFGYYCLVIGVVVLIAAIVEKVLKG